MSSEFNEVYHHRLRYFLTPQFDMYRIVRERLEREGGLQKVLDYGCGNGVGSVLLKNNGWDIMGLDSDEEAIHFAQDAWSHLCQFRHADWSSLNPLSVTENTYDAIVCLEVIEHVEHPELLLGRFKDRVRPGGILVVSTLNHNSQYRKNRGHIGKFTLESFRNLIGKHFHGAVISDFLMDEPLVPGSTRTPMVAYWRAPE